MAQLAVGAVGGTGLPPELAQETHPITLLPKLGAVPLSATQNIEPQELLASDFGCPSDFMLTESSLIVASYLLGALPQVYLLARVRGLDLRKEGDLHIALWYKGGCPLGLAGWSQAVKAFFSAVSSTIEASLSPLVAQTGQMPYNLGKWRQSRSRRTFGN